jgi:UPF0271 protein
MNVVPFGDAAWRVELPEGVDRAALLRRLLALPGVTDALVTDRHALVCFTPAQPPAGLERCFDSVGSADAAAPRLHVVRVRYDGPDLAEVAASLGLTTDAVAALHASVAYEVQLVGFVPGFAYLGPLPAPLASVPRRPTPRPRVPAGSVAIAAGRTAVYPFASPGGWQLLGRALDFAPFDPAAGPRLALGDRVRFEPA